MQALVISETNRAWNLTEVADPRPQAGQVVIRVRYSGMCGTDLHVHRGHFSAKLPIVAGHEPTGEIVELGAGVTDLKVGDRVGVFWYQKGCGRCPSCQSGETCPTAQSWLDLGGGNSELMLAWASGCALIPDGLALDAAAPIFCAGYTVMSALRNASPKPGERVAILGVGGLGHLAIQLSRALGLETFAITGQSDKRAELLALGADEVLVTDDHPGKVLERAGGADIVISTTNSAKQIGSIFDALRPRGRLINTGVADGPIMIDSLTSMLGHREFRGVVPDRRSHLREVLDLAAKGKVKPTIEVYPLAQANAVRDRLEAGKVRYRAVLAHA
ncbi:Alcohol dehydrogenase [Labilithrix luteola]|uniref:alcohol dehydrogenase n=1 Tax=Labilithrix luteola TaxID=1391654 RepID=A0A0K1PP33_9BACT|nr:alcohol dehydrogenase catalytic domain-containing protein [Labilithrix luteola]AKU95295.1 Alcohol dehydrogenase [Labilithrix luteola]